MRGSGQRSIYAFSVVCPRTVVTCRQYTIALSAHYLINCKVFWQSRTFKLFVRQWSQRGLPLRPIQSDWRAMYTLGFGMRMVSCPSSLGSTVESESSRCFEDDMFKIVSRLDVTVTKTVVYQFMVAIYGQLHLCALLPGPKITNCHLT